MIGDDYCTHVGCTQTCQVCESWHRFGFSTYTDVHGCDWLRVGVNYSHCHVIAPLSDDCDQKPQPRLMGLDEVLRHSVHYRQAV